MCAGGIGQGWGEGLEEEQRERGGRGCTIYGRISSFLFIAMGDAIATMRRKITEVFRLTATDTFQQTQPETKNARGLENARGFASLVQF